ncbi:unnamed protein product [Schistosoma mattheei]|uniref:Uncharacterized protein n=1 Tax=Schistosoma mattheei TaxID=31246 RepID=A0A183NFR3_9TREM|nr:unnamed protein product [Schistosoma mattheei]
MAVGGSRQETLDSGFVLLGTRQQGVPVILRELVLPGGFDPHHPASHPETLKLNNCQTFRLSLNTNVHLADGCQLERNLSLLFPAD